MPSINAAGAAVATTQKQVLQTYDAKWVTDLEFAYRYGKRFSFAIGANNLFDVYPTTNIRSTAAFQGSDNVGIFPYNGISPFGFNGAFYYSKVSFKF